MKASRRAVPDAARPGTVPTMRSTVVALTTALVSTTGLLALLAGRVARRVVTLSARVPDTTLVDVDVAAQTITLSRSADTVLPGRYGLFTTGTQSYIKLGTVLAAGTGAAVLAVGFLLFRVFDVTKPFPAGASQRLGGGVGVMIDDLIAGLYGLAVFLLLHTVVGWP